MRGQFAAAAGARVKVFDWDKAATIIRAFQPREAEAGLIEDWGCTGGTIFENGKRVPEADTYVYLASNWATPTLAMDGEDHPCWKYMEETPGWDSNTYWPDSAVKIMEEPPR